MRIAALGIASSVCIFAGSISSPAFADDQVAPSAYPEEVTTWSVRKGDTCESIAKAQYGDAKYASLIFRYNKVGCSAAAPLGDGLSLVLPKKVGSAAFATVTSTGARATMTEKGKEAKPVSDGDKISVETQLSAGPRDLQLELANGVRVTFSSSASGVLTDPADSAANKRTGPYLELTRGELEVRVPHDADASARVEIGTPGGKRVIVLSGTATVSAAADGVSVSVVGGEVSIAGDKRTVRVSSGFGTHLGLKGDPEAPRSLLPAPTWAESEGAIVVAPKGEAALHGSWSQVTHTREYRIEIATDARFMNVFERVRVQSVETGFRLDRVPAGSYFMRVRAVDDDGFVGAPSEATKTAVVEVSLVQGGGSVGKTLSVTSDTILKLDPVPEVELQIGSSRFNPMPGTVDLADGHPDRLVFRVGGPRGAILEVPVQYSKIEAEVRISQGRASEDDSMHVFVRAPAGSKLDTDMTLDAHVFRGNEVERVHLKPISQAVDKSEFVGPLVGSSDVTRIEIWESNGSMIGTLIPPQREPAFHPVGDVPETRKPDRVGVTAPGFSLSPYGPPLWWAPNGENAGSVGAVAEGDFKRGDPASFSGRLLTTASLGPVGLEIQLRADSIGSVRAADPGGWAGGRVKFFGGKQGDIDLGAAVRVGFPITKYSNPVRLEPGFALGSEMGRWSWLLDLGTRLQLEHRVTGAFAMPLVFVGGGTYQVTSWLRGEATVDAEAVMDSTAEPCVICKDNAAHPDGGISLGVEAGTSVFGAVVGRLSPFDAHYGNISGQAIIGVRYETSNKPPTTPPPLSVR